MPNPNLPDTPDVANALVTYLQAVTLSGNPLYTTGGVNLGQFKDLSALLPANGTNVAAEVHGAADISQRYTTGGRVKDHTTFTVLSLVDMTTESAAWTLMYQVRDAIVPYIMQHSQLTGTGNVLVVKLVSGGKYLKAHRGDKFYLGYMYNLEVVSEWTVSTGFIS